MLEDVSITATDLLDVRMDHAHVTEAGLRMNLNVGILYIASWLRGVGAAAIHNLMEDAATAEISRAQVWQWIHHSVRTQEGRLVDRAYVELILEDEISKIKATVGEEGFVSDQYAEAETLFRDLIFQKEFSEFLTTGAYTHFQ